MRDWDSGTVVGVRYAERSGRKAHARRSRTTYWRPMRVLLVEDYAPLARSMVQGLREAGFAVDHVTEGDEALALGETNPYDAIILDIMVPKVDGLEILRRLRPRGRARPSW